MALSFFKWSRTASSNATADPNVNWAEGQAPSSINDSARAMMASAAGFRDDISGAIATGGTSTAYTVTSYQVFDSVANMDGKMIAFTPNATSTNAVAVDVTLAVDGLTAKPIRQFPNVTLPTGHLISGTPYLAVYNNSDGVFYLHNTANQYVIPLGAGMDFWGSTTPNSCFAFPTGQAISRTTYATLFSLIGTTYGTGDGSTTFNLPDKTGRVSAMKEATATRLTSAGSGVDGGTIGAHGGAQTETLVTANLPPYTPSGSINIGSINQGYVRQSFAMSAGGTNVVNDITGVGNNQTFTISPSGTFSGTAQGGTSTPVVTVQPTIVCNYIMRII